MIQDSVTKQLMTKFSGMKNRCYSEKNPGYHRYGGRGIKIYKPWLENPKTFVDWAVENGYQPGLSIDRINNDHSYTPNNCQFITKKQNSNKGTKTDILIPDLEESDEILIRETHIDSKVFKYYEMISQLIYNSDRETVIPYILTGYLIGVMKKHNLTIDGNIIDYYNELKNKLYPKEKPKRKVKDAPVQGNFTKDEISNAMQERITEEQELDLEKDFVEEKPKEGITDAR